MRADDANGGNVRRERMVAHDIADASFLLAVMARRRTFFQENSSERDVIERCANRRIRGGAMFRGGSFDRSGAGLELYVGWRKRREVGLSSSARTRAASGTRTRRPSCLESNLGSPQWCMARRWLQRAVRKGLFNDTDIVTVVADEFPPEDPELEDQFGSLEAAEAYAVTEFKIASSDMKNATRTFMKAKDLVSRVKHARVCAFDGFQTMTPRGSRQTRSGKGANTGMNSQTGKGRGRGVGKGKPLRDSRRPSPAKSRVT